MRLTLDLARARVFALGTDSDPIAQLSVTLGDPALDVVILGPDAQPQFAADAVLQFVARAPVPGAAVPDFDGTTIVSGQAAVTSGQAADAPQILNCAENWKAAALVALFGADQGSVNLFGQYRWQFAADAPWQKAAAFPIVAANSLFPDDFVPSAAPVASAPRTYLDQVTDYVGADQTALDHTPIIGLPAGTLFDAVINGVLVTVKKVAGTDVTNVALGVIRTADFNALTNPFVLVRVAGV